MQFFDDDNEKGDYMIKKLLQPFRFHGRHKIDFVSYLGLGCNYFKYNDYLSSRYN